MPVKDINCENTLFPSVDARSFLRLPHESWLPVLQYSCDFPPNIFETVSLNILKNPNINSSLLFRADILYDSSQIELPDVSPLQAEQLDALGRYNLQDGEFPEYEVKRTILRRMIPRNPQLDRPIAQTCLFLKSKEKSDEFEQTVVIYIPHSPSIDELPWYHPRVQSLAYLHSWCPNSNLAESQGNVSLHFRLFSPETLPMSPRLERTGQQLLSTIHKHGQGQLVGYRKRVHHDQLISQQLVQDTYTELKRKHANRLCGNWVEKTEPSKHVFEDLGIAAFLIELWKPMYQSDNTLHSDLHDGSGVGRPSFPGFVDVGCGNGVLVDVLLREGYYGWGFDARRRKTWNTFEASIQEHLKQLILIPQPLFETQQVADHLNYANGGIISKRLSSSAIKGLAWHNGIFPKGTFIISNHADELTPWTPLLASISSSPFLAIPCCSHNLSGLRFRAPSVFNSNSADVLAPTYFAAKVNKSKSIAIAIACPDNAEIFGQGPEGGDLNDLSPKSRSKQPSAYSSLCDWVAHLAARVGYKVEREMLRLPSTRNVGLVGRTMMQGYEDETLEERRGRVGEIAGKENADGVLWVERAQGLIGGNDCGH